MPEMTVGMAFDAKGNALSYLENLQKRLDSVKEAYAQVSSAAAQGERALAQARSAAAREVVSERSAASASASLQRQRSSALMQMYRDWDRAVVENQRRQQTAESAAASATVSLARQRSRAVTDMYRDWDRAIAENSRQEQRAARARQQADSTQQAWVRSQRRGTGGVLESIGAGLESRGLWGAMQNGMTSGLAMIPEYGPLLAGGASLAFSVGNALDRVFTTSVGLATNALRGLWSIGVKAFQAVEGAVVSVANRIVSLAKWGTAAGAALGAGFLTEAIKQGVSMETQWARLKTALQDVAATTKMWGYTMRFAAWAPFDIAETREAAAMLELYGLNAYKWLTLVGNTAAAMRHPIQEVAVAFGETISGAPGGMRRLQMLGLSHADLLAAGAQEGDRPGTISYQTEEGRAALAIALERLSTRKFGTGMEEMMKSTEGRWSNFRDALIYNFQSIGQGILNSVRGPLYEVSQWFFGLYSSGAPLRWGQSIGNVFTQIVSAAKTVMASGVLERIWGALNSVYNAIAGATGGTDLGSVATRVFSAVARGFEFIAQVVTTNNLKAAGDWLKWFGNVATWLYDIVTRNFPGIAAEIKFGFQTVIHWSSELYNSLAKLLPMIGGLIDISMKWQSVKLFAQSMQMYQLAINLAMKGQFESAGQAWTASQAAMQAGMFAWGAGGKVSKTANAMGDWIGKHPWHTEEPVAPKVDWTDKWDPREYQMRAAEAAAYERFRATGNPRAEKFRPSWYGQPNYGLNYRFPDMPTAPFGMGTVPGPQPFNFGSTGATPFDTGAGASSQTYYYSEQDRARQEALDKAQQHLDESKRTNALLENMGRMLAEGYVSPAAA